MSDVVGSTRIEQDRQTRLHRLHELFAPHVRDLVGEEAGRRTLFLPLGLVDDVAMRHGPGPATVRSIIERALAGEAAMIVREWTLLIVEHARDQGNALRSSSLDDAMLPPFAPDLARIFDECCGRRLAGRALTLEVLRRVRRDVPGGKPLPADAVHYVESRGIRLEP